jgi:hypothetical protein
LARVPAAQGPRKGDNLKPHLLGIPENEFVSAIIGEPILIVGHTMQAPVAQPIAPWVSGGSSCLRSRRRNDIRFHCSLLVHSQSLRQQRVEGQFSEAKNLTASK